MPSSYPKLSSRAYKRAVRIGSVRKYDNIVRRTINDLGPEQLDDSNLPTAQQSPHSSGSGQQIQASPAYRFSPSLPNSNTRTVHEEYSEFGELGPKLPRFGPCYGEDIDAIKAAKNEAFERVLDATSYGRTLDIRQRYFSVIASIKKEAKDAYSPTIVNPLGESEFQRMMVIDGCFFLQLAICILGGRKLLSYPEESVYFGDGKYGEHEQEEEKMINEWIKAMFFVGNQLPCVVLRDLMGQDFFQDIIKEGTRHGTWSNPPSELPKLVLYLVVVQPELETCGNCISGMMRMVCGKRGGAPRFREKPSDLLHALHHLVMGPQTDDFFLEAWTRNDWEEDLEADAGIEDDNDDDLDLNNRFPSAKELRQSGIKLTKAKWGFREIKFNKRFFFFGYLYVPPLEYDSRYTELMLRCLKRYELGFDKEEREVTAHLRFMKELIRTPRDFKILESRGIIQVKTEDDRYKLIGLIRRLGSSKGVTSTQELRRVRLQITDYSRPPWSLIIAVTLLLTLVQTIFAVLAYFLPRT